MSICGESKAVGGYSDDSLDFLFIDVRILILCPWAAQWSLRFIKQPTTWFKRKAMVFQD